MASPDPGATSKPAGPLRRGLAPVTERTRVTTAEIFFDLVFVFAFIQVTTLMTTEANVLGVVHGLLVLTMLWWSWSLFAWLGNRVRANYGLSRLVLLAVTPVMFALAVTTREAFTDLPGGLYSPLTFVASFVILRLVYLALRWYSSPPLGARDWIALTTPMLVASLLLVGAALLPLSRLDEHIIEIGQVVLWATAVAVDYAIGMALRVSQRAIFSVRHWTERHSLIIIVALGETLIAIGIAGTDLPNTIGLMVASVLAVVIAGALEWIYFDLSALAGEHALRHADTTRRVTLARDGYTYLHLPMIAGVILLAVGLKHTPSLIVAAHTYRQGDPLEPLSRYAMYGGVALFLTAHAAFQWRLDPQLRTIVWPRLLAAAALLATLPVTGQVSAARTLVWLALICLLTAGTEFVVSRAQRRRLRKTLADDAEGNGCEGREPGGRAG